jgi:hypothetical protein
MWEPCNRIALAAGIVAVLAGLTYVRARSLSRYQPILQQIQRGTLQADPAGVIRLPPAFAGLTPRDEVYIEQKPDGRLFILFPTWYGRGSDIEGYLYCSQALRQSDYYLIHTTRRVRHQYIDVAGRDLLIATYQRPHWYKISRRLD